MTTPDRCPHCGVALHSVDVFEFDTGELHTAERCRDYLVAERDRLKLGLERIVEHSDEHPCNAARPYRSIARGALAGIDEGSDR